MTTIRMAEDQRSRLERFARSQGLADVDQLADIQAIVDSISNLASAKLVIAKMLVEVLALRARVRRLEQGR